MLARPDAVYIEPHQILGDDVAIPWERSDRKASNGSCRRGLFSADVSVEELTRAFGKHDGVGGRSINDKVKFEWVLDIAGVIVTIYDYYEHRWHIGGHTDAAPYLLAIVLKQVGIQADVEAEGQ